MLNEFLQTRLATVSEIYTHIYLLHRDCLFLNYIVMVIIFASGLLEKMYTNYSRFYCSLIFKSLTELMISLQIFPVCDLQDTNHCLTLFEMVIYDFPSIRFQLCHYFFEHVM